MASLKYVLNEKELTNIAAFHSHQCIEKSFKALVFIETDTIPRIHNLIKLYGTVRNYFSLDIDLLVLEQINETYIDARYPSELGLLPDGDLSQEKANLFFKESEKIYSQIKKIITNSSPEV